MCLVKQANTSLVIVRVSRFRVTVRIKVNVGMPVVVYCTAIDRTSRYRMPVQYT